MTWLDRLARRTAQREATTVAPPGASDASDATPRHSGSTRRDFMKKAAVVTGLAWTTPVLQSVVVPAAAVSGHPILGEGCPSPGSPCVDGSVCSPGNICGGLAATCNSDFDCLYGNCHGGVCGSPGATCKHDSGCVYGNCTHKVCGSPGADCTSNGDCQYANCGPADKHGDRVCGSKGASCTHDTQCKGNLVCTAGVCSK